MFSRPGLASIDVVAANSWDDALEGVGEGANISPIVSGMSFEARNIFERQQDRLGASVQFGEMSPVEIDQARARVSLARERSTDGRNRRNE